MDRKGSVERIKARQAKAAENRKRKQEEAREAKAREHREEVAQRYGSSYSGRGRPPKIGGKQAGYYLQYAQIEWLENEARTHGVSKSEILRQVIEAAMLAQAETQGGEDQ